MAEKKLKSVAKATQAKTSVKVKSGNVAVGKFGAAKTIAEPAEKKTMRKTAKSSVTKKVSVPAARSQVLPKDLAVMTKPKDAKVKTTLTPEERYCMVETAAYFIAEQHGFYGRSDEHWAAAERQIAAIGQ